MKTTYVYFVQAGEAIKIGVACDVKKRIANIQTYNSDQVRFRFAVRCVSRQQVLNLEGRIHHWQRKHKIRNEWFRPACIEGFEKNISGISQSKDKLIYDLESLA